MSTVTTPTTPDSGGLAPDPVVTPTRKAGTKKLPIIFGVLTALLAVVLLLAGLVAAGIVQETQA